MREIDRDARKKARDEPGLFAGRSSSDRALGLTMRDRLVACCPCFETLASLAPQHEVVVFQQVRPHPEVATKWPSRRMGCNTDLRFQVLASASSPPSAQLRTGRGNDGFASRAAYLFLVALAFGSGFSACGSKPI